MLSLPFELRGRARRALFAGRSSEGVDGNRPLACGFDLVDAAADVAFRGRRRKRGAALVATIAWASTAAAHGVPAAVTGVAAAGPDGPSVVLASEGLVQRLGGEWHYVCPAQFGNELSPPALSVDGERTFVVGQNDLFVLGPDGTVTPQGEPALSRRFVVGLGAAGGQLYGFRFENGSTEIRAVSGTSDTPLWRGDQIYESLSADDEGFWVARTADGVGHATRLDLAGSPSGEHTFVVEPGEIVNKVSQIQGSVYVSILTPFFAGRLLRLGADGGATAFLKTTSPLIGPLSLDAGVAFFIADGVLEILGTGSSSPAYEDRATCLGRLGSFSYLCARTKLLALTASGPKDLLLDLADLKGPIAAPAGVVSTHLGDDCALQWVVFQNDLRAIGVLPPADAGTTKIRGEAAPAAQESSGCAIGRAENPTGIRCLVLLAGLVAARTIRRARSRR
ncbi:MAG TPA: hypothetical protein VF395_02070 [Polyangiaceae bacterium]